MRRNKTAMKRFFVPAVPLPLDHRFEYQVLAALQERRVEDCEWHPAQKMLENALASNPDAARDAMAVLFHSLLDRPGKAADLLRCVGRLDADLVGPVGMYLVKEGLGHVSAEVRMAAIRAIEHWKTPRLVAMLGKHREQSMLLGRYIEQIRRDRRIIVPAVPLSLNRLLRLHWTGRRKENNRWWHLIAQAAGVGPMGRRKKARMWVSIGVWRKRVQDHDNACGSLKPVMDALRRLRWIVDDSPKWITLHQVEWPANGEPERTEIKLEEMPRETA